MIRSSLYISFAGESSEVYKILNVNTSSGLYSEPFVGSRSINETKTRGNDIPYFHNIENDTLEFTCQLAFENEPTSDELRTVKRWLLSPTYYTELIFSDDPDKLFYALVVGQPQYIHNGTSGYLECNFRCSSNHGYGSYLSQTETISATPVSYTITNNGDLSCLPIFKFTKIGAGTVSVTNLSNSSEQLEITGLLNGEIVQIDGNTEIIENSPMGRITFTGVTSDTEKVNIGSITYEFDTNGSVTAGNVTVDISLGNSAIQSATALVASINSDVLSVVYATLGETSGTVDIAGIGDGVAGSLVATTETCVNASFGSATLVDRYLYSSWNGKIITLLVGANTLQFSGEGTMNIKHQTKLM